MTTLEVLRELYDEAMNTVFAYSANYLMNSPKKGYEREFEKAEFRASVLESLIEREEREAAATAEKNTR